jgi:ASC-1-like (ASCH) protein
MRNQYKQVSFSVLNFLYPTPVIKELKYLIELDEKLTNFFIFAFEHKYLESADSKPSFLVEDRVHEDGRTKIYQIDYSNLHFSLLKNKSLDLKKANSIEKLLRKKIVEFLRGEEKSKDALLNTFEKQKKCSTCLKLGIDDPNLKQLMIYLIETE